MELWKRRRRKTFRMKSNKRRIVAFGGSGPKENIQWTSLGSSWTSSYQFLFDFWSFESGGGGSGGDRSISSRISRLKEWFLWRKYEIGVFLDIFLLIEWRKKDFGRCFGALKTVETAAPEHSRISMLKEWFNEGNTRLESSWTYSYRLSEEKKGFGRLLELWKRRQRKRRRWISLRISRLKSSQITDNKPVGIFIDLYLHQTTSKHDFKGIFEMPERRDNSNSELAFGSQIELVIKLKWAVIG